MGPKTQNRAAGARVWSTKRGGRVLSGRGDPIGVGYARFGVVGMRSRDARDGGAGFWSQKPNPSPSSLDLANKMWGFSVLGTKNQVGLWKCTRGGIRVVNWLVCRGWSGLAHLVALCLSPFPIPFVDHGLARWYQSMHDCGGIVVVSHSTGHAPAWECRSALVWGWRVVRMWVPTHWS